MSKANEGELKSMFTRMRAMQGRGRVENLRLPDVTKHATTLVAVEAVLRAGASIMLGRTSDGGAMAVTVFDGDEKLRAYPANEVEYNACIQEIIQRYS